MARILLIGAIHEYQRESAHCSMVLRPWPEKLKLYLDQRAEYQKWIRERVKEFGPSLIFDEMNLAEEDHSDRLEDTGIPWVYMDIPEHVRRRFGLSVPRSPENPIIKEVDERRESHWRVVVGTLSQILEVDRVMVICGAAHLELLNQKEPFGEKLRDDGHDVDTIDIRNEPWCNLGWKTDLRPE